MSSVETPNAVTVYCPECDAPFHLPNRDLLGQLARCWNCRAKVLLEEPSFDTAVVAEISPSTNPVSSTDSEQVPEDLWEEALSEDSGNKLELDQSVAHQLRVVRPVDCPTSEISSKPTPANDPVEEETNEAKIVACGYCQTRFPFIGDLLETQGCPCCGAKVGTIQHRLIDVQPDWTQQAALVIEEQQQGPFGTLYHGVQTDQNRRVTVRKFPDDSESPESKQHLASRLWQMRRRIKSVDFAFDEITLHQNDVYLIGPPIEGVSLADHLVRNTISTQEAAQIGGTVADVLDAAHHNGLVHRDIKPANVLITPRGLRVLGFGMPRRKTGAGYLKGPRGLVVGTVGYLAPEQALGNGPSDPRSDIYSLGVLLFQMVTGQLPFRGSLPQVLNQITKKPLPSLSSLRNDVPWEWDVICRRCTAKQPEDRYQSASEVSEALKQLG